MQKILIITGISLLLVSVIIISDCTSGSPIEENSAPEAKDISIDGIKEHDKILKGIYTYSDADGDKEGNTSFKWYRCDDGDGINDVEIAGATESTYTTIFDDAGKCIRFEVTPVAETGTKTGSPEISSAFGQVSEPPQRIYIFYAGDYNGNLGGRSGADSLCLTAKNNNFSFLPDTVTTVKAFLSVDIGDEIINLVGESYPVYGVKTDQSITKISDTWEDLWDGNIDVDLQTALGIDSLWWSGSNQYGAAVIETCNAWTSEASTDYAETGHWNRPNIMWIYYNNELCNDSRPLLGVAY